MMRALPFLLCLAPPVWAQSGAVTVPSGTPLYVQEVVLQPGDSHLRLVLTPGAGALTRARVDGDFDMLCDLFLDRLSRVDRAPDAIVIAIADRELPFGKPAPDAVQLFEAYDIVDGSCQWRAF